MRHCNRTLDPGEARAPAPAWDTVENVWPTRRGVTTIAGSRRGLLPEGYLVAVLALVSVGLAFGGYAAYRSESRRIADGKYEDLVAVAELKVGQIVSWRQGALTDARRPGRGPYFRRGIAEWLRDRQAPGVEEALGERLRFELEADRYVDAFVFDPSGRLLLSARPQSEFVDKVTEETVRAAIAAGEAVIGELHRVAGTIVVDVAAPIADSDGHAIAAFVLRSDAETFLYPLIQSWPTSSRSAETLLVRRDGNEAVFLNELRHVGGRALVQREPITHAQLPAVAAVLGIRGRFVGRDYRGVEVLADLCPIPGSSWFLVAKVDAAEIVDEARSRALVGFFAVALLVIVVGGSTAFIYQHRRHGERQRLARVQAARLRVLELATTEVSIEDLLRTTVDEAGRMTGSPVGFVYFVAADQKTISLQACSTGAEKEFCAAQGKERPQGARDADIWADCVQRRSAVVRNGGVARRGRTRSSEGLNVLQREIVVPIIRGKRIVAMLGVGNKSTNYSEGDVAHVAELADLAWDIVARRQSESARMDSRNRCVSGNAWNR